ncbi:hypothetical protein LC082_11425 [Microbacterium esteraromaticum]|uniref:hypothetical protein n=1 Tax=Microbacterium esteraromaticum TaxID=57043 RepID=UPI001CD48D83|nr:hypothetical protein [Microbacterium esteraromaticum]MCA1307511.1 hypothetical protein [Microbacterium esteraromaticum]
MQPVCRATAALTGPSTPGTLAHELSADSRCTTSIGDTDPVAGRLDRPRGRQQPIGSDGTVEHRPSKSGPPRRQRLPRRELGVAVHDLARFHEPRRAPRVDPQSALQQFVHIAASRAVRQVNRIARRDRLDDGRLNAPQSIASSTQNDAPLGIGEAHERIRTEQLIEVGDDSIENCGGVGHASIQQGATNIDCGDSG